MKGHNNKINILSVNSENSFGSFYNKYYSRFVRYAYYYVKDISTAEDMTQDALLHYWEKRKSLPQDTDVLGYILTSVKNKCLDYLKHLRIVNEFNGNKDSLEEWKIETRISILENDGYNMILSQEISGIIEKTIANLPEMTQKIFKYNKIEHKSNKEIAALFGISKQAVNYHIQKALKFLSMNLKEYY